MPDRPAEASTLADFVRIARRRKWMIIAAAIIVPCVAVALSVRKPALYESAAEVLLSRQNIAASFAGVPDVYASQDAARYSATQAFLASSPRVAVLVVSAAKVPGLTAASFLGSSSVAANPNADLLSFRVRNADPVVAALLANEFATQFTLYRRQLDTTAIDQARSEIRARMQDLVRQGQSRTQLYSDLDAKEQQLATVEALQRSNAYLARPAGGAVKIQPRPKREGLLGLGLGIFLGLGLAFLREALDTRLRTTEDIQARLGLPLLGRLSEPSRGLKASYGLVMLSDPYSVQAEAFRMLRTNIELANLERRAQVIMVTSALEEEGKTTTVANLAIAMARAGRHVVLVDLDLRRPSLDHYFHVERHVGLTDVALGDTTLASALVQVSVTDPARSALGVDVGSQPVQGLLEVLPAGPLPPDPGEFVGNHVLAGILDMLRARAEIILIDTPPVLHAGDALALSTRVDAVVVVARLNLARRAPLQELRRLIDTVPAEKLGFVLTGADTAPDYKAHAYSPRAYAYAEEREAPR